MSDEEHHFESKADAGASKTYPQQAGTIRKNGYIVIKGRPCKVIQLPASRSGELIDVNVYLHLCSRNLMMSVHPISRCLGFLPCASSLSLFGRSIIELDANCPEEIATMVSEHSYNRCSIDLHQTVKVHLNAIWG
ncbi:Eukaryotic translation initiation factor 5A-3 [Apostasia shenzhenica]|uniref:Eukaryotic translation initiation factor 5A-3 n=1 Tax=Apostasia shenzhenica TaxID=1088818 RepID=A0A2I0A0Z7_9ASPA|nr:Eukaryotic translation initiation factor 5A-3 [Apostasia shenzhenica]